MNDLTYRDFLAYLINELNHPDTPQLMWTITRSEVKQERLAEADRLFKKWKKTELTADRARKDLKKGRALFKVENDHCTCNQINWIAGPHHQTDCPMWTEESEESEGPEQ